MRTKQCHSKEWTTKEWRIFILSRKNQFALLLQLKGYRGQTWAWVTGFGWSLHNEFKYLTSYCISFSVVWIWLVVWICLHSFLKAESLGKECMKFVVWLWSRKNPAEMIYKKTWWGEGSKYNCIYSLLIFPPLTWFVSFPWKILVLFPHFANLVNCWFFCLLTLISFLIIKLSGLSMVQCERWMGALTWVHWWWYCRLVTVPLLFTTEGACVQARSG